MFSVQAEHNLSPIDIQQIEIKSNKDKKIKSPYLAHEIAQLVFDQRDREDQKIKTYYDQNVSSSHWKSNLKLNFIEKAIDKVIREMAGSELASRNYGIAVAKFYKTLLDPHINFFPLKFVEQTEKASDEIDSYQGVGLTVKRYNRQVLVKEVIKGSSADQKGIVPGDQVIKINGKMIDQMSLSKINELLEIEKDETLKVVIKKNNQNSKYNLEWGKFNLKNIFAELIQMGDKRILYVKLRTFLSKGLAGQMAQYLKEGAHKYEAYDGVIIDLRDNPGGYLAESVDLASLFIGKHLDVMEYREVKSPYEIIDKGDGEYTRSIKHTAREKIVHRPTMVLVNRHSASASEVFLGILQEWSEDIFSVGTQTYGKGTVQSPVDNWNDTPYALRDNQFVQNVIIYRTKSSYHHARSGSTPQKVGIIPDFSAEIRAVPWPEEKFAYTERNLFTNVLETYQADQYKNHKRLKRVQFIKDCLEKGEGLNTSAYFASAMTNLYIDYQLERAKDALKCRFSI